MNYKKEFLNYTKIIFCSVLWSSTLMANTVKEQAIQLHIHPIQINFSETPSLSLIMGGLEIPSETLKISSKIEKDILSLEFQTRFSIKETSSLAIVDMQNFPIYKFKNSEAREGKENRSVKLKMDAPVVKRLIMNSTPIRFCHIEDLDYIVLHFCTKKMVLMDRKIEIIPNLNKENKYFINEKEVGTNGSLFLEDEKGYANFAVDFSSGERMTMEISKPRISTESDKSGIRIKIMEKSLSFEKSKIAKLLKLKNESRKINVKVYDSFGFEFTQKMTVDNSNQIISDDKSDSTGSD